MSKVKLLIYSLLLCVLCCVLCSCGTPQATYTIQYADGNTTEMTHQELLEWQTEYGTENFKKEILENIIVSGVGTVTDISASTTNCVYKYGNCRIVQVHITLDTNTRIVVYVDIPEPGYGKSNSDIENFTNINVGDKIEFKTIGDPVTWCSKSMCKTIKEDGGIIVNLGVAFEPTNEDTNYTGFQALKYFWENQVESLTVIEHANV